MENRLTGRAEYRTTSIAAAAILSTPILGLALHRCLDLPSAFLGSLFGVGCVMLIGSEPAIDSSKPCSSLRSGVSGGFRCFRRFWGTAGSAPRFFAAGSTILVSITKEAFSVPWHKLTGLDSGNGAFLPVRLVGRGAYGAGAVGPPARCWRAYSITCEEPWRFLPVPAEPAPHPSVGSVR